MARIFGDIVSEAGELLNRTDPQMRTVLKQSVNRRYREILQAESWPELHREITVTVSAGESTVGVPFEAEIVRSVYNTGASLMLERLDPVAMDQRFGATLDTTGTLRHFSVTGVRGTYANPIAGTQMVVRSSSSEDSCLVRITGFSSDGEPFDASATVNGTNYAILLPLPVNYPGGEVLTFTKDNDTAGRIQLLQAIPPNIMGYISANERAARYTWLRFSTASDVDVSLRVQAVVYPPDFEDDNDVPILRGIEHILVIGAEADGYRYLREHQKATGEELRYMELVRDYLHRRNAEDGRSIQSSGSMDQYRSVWRD